MIKIFPQIDIIPATLIEELKFIANSFQATALIVGMETRKTVLRDDVIYERRGLPALNLTTFKRILTNNKIYTISRKGGFYVRVDGEKIRQLRLKHDFSLQEVASRIGVSRKAVYLFDQMDQMKEENVKELEKLFEESFKFPVDIFDWDIELKEIQRPSEETEFQMEIKENLEDIGFMIDWLKKAPFDGIASEIDKKNPRPEVSALITDVHISPRKRIIDRVKMISDISRYAQKLSIFIIEEGKLSPIENVLILQKHILEKMKDIKDLFKELRKVKRSFI